MHRTGFESVMWHLLQEQRRDRLAAPALVGLWFAGWLSFLLTLLAPLG
ncbi:MAG TPA: hypothetical protein VN947_15960 [Polyangia bacterium]|nr:hypothetical protein [Polyangia bacterium]